MGGLPCCVEVCNTVTPKGAKGKGRGTKEDDGSSYRDGRQLSDRQPIDREGVLLAAEALVRERGPAALTMRKLAAELGAAVTAIYWHVGNREALLDELVQRTVAEMGQIEARGATPAARAESV